MDNLLAQLGIPKRIFEGEPRSTPYWEEYKKKLEARTLYLREVVVEPIMQTMVEKALPELFWEPLFLCSPRGFARVRREVPVKITWEDVPCQI